MLCRSGSRNTNYRLHVFADCLRVVFNSSQAAAPGLPPAHLGYKVHVHMEKSKVIMLHVLNTLTAGAVDSCESDDCALCQLLSAFAYYKLAHCALLLHLPVCLYCHPVTGI